jgi:hypothetical protein
MQEFYRALDAGLVPILDAVAEETKAEPPTRNLTDADEKSIQEIFPRIFFVDAASRGSLDIQAPVFVIPNGNLARITSSWNRVLLHGKNILRKPTADEIEEDTTFRRVDQVDAGNFRTIIRTSPHDSGPVTAIGQVVLELPLTFHTATFDCEKPSAAKVGVYEFQLRRCTNDFVEFIQKTPEAHPLEPTIRIYGASRDPLVVVQSSVDALFPGGKGILDVDFKSLPDRIEAKRYRFLVKGKAKRIVLSYNDRVLKKTFSVTALSEPDYQNPKSSPNNRFVNITPVASQMISDSELRSSLKVAAERNPAYFGFNTPRLILEAPAFSGLKYAKVEWKDVQLIDPKGQPVAFSLSDSACDFEKHSCTVSLEDKTGDGFPAYSRATGKVGIRLPRSVLVSRGPFADKVAISARGMRVDVSLPGSPPDSPLLAPGGVIASGRTGNFVGPLQKLAFESTESESENENGESSSRPGDRTETRTFYFWGDVADVQLVLTRDWTQVELSFDLPAPQTLSEDQRGH